VGAHADDSPVVTVTVVLYNSEPVVGNCIESIRPELESGFAELLAVDNCSPDDSAQVVQRVAPAARVLRTGSNLGFAAGANQAWPHAKGHYWMLLNPDARLSPSGLRVMAEWMDRHPSVGMASAELRNEDGVLQGAGQPFPSPWLALLEASRIPRLLPAGIRGQLLRSHYRPGDQTDAGFVPGTAVMARREAVEQAGPLDERFFLHGEDVEWCWRMRSAGWSLGVCSAAVATHDGCFSSLATFSSGENRRRMTAGGLEAVRMAKGDRYARAWAIAMEAGHRIEARHPRRTAQHREAAREWAEAWRTSRRAS
jgi:GT2 family glycosyltransferase